jgi:putative oxidoreductase
VIRTGLQLYAKVTDWLSGATAESALLFFVRIVLAGIFWRSGRTKVEEGSWFSISDSTYDLFHEDYSGVPLPPEIATVAATAAEHLFPLLLVLGLATRFSAFALLIMTMVIQFFVFPEAWWPVHSLWTALALVLIARGGGLVSLDSLLWKRVRQSSPLH